MIKGIEIIVSIIMRKSFDVHENLLIYYYYEFVNSFKFLFE